MICPSCRTAGDWARQAREYMFAPPDEVSPERVAELHAKCPGGSWCDCQHVQPGARPRLSIS